MSSLGPSVHDERVIRVFVSSTFRDMQAEREELVKRIFPQLRNLCESRGVTWGDVDLRWGVTDEQKADGLVLPICLAEIRRCRPYFIGLLGERYGWVPDRLPPDVVASEPWLAAHQGRSVTELEILHGVLNDPAMAGHAFFYFRDPAYAASRPAGEQGNYLDQPLAEEIACLGAHEAERRADARRRALAQLKDRIRASGLPVRENFSNPIAFGELVLRDLTAVIDRLFPVGSEPGVLDRERAAHAAFARTRSDVYIGRDADFDRLDQHVLGEGPPLVVVGESGMGKSALLANWATRFKIAHPECTVITHFVGASGLSTDWAVMVGRLLAELNRRCGLDEGRPESADALRAAFTAGLRRAGSHGRLVLMIDALDQLENRDGAPDLVWLPANLPPGVRLVVSTLPGRPLDELNRRSCRVVEVAPLGGAERAQLIEQYLAQYAKALSCAQSDRIRAAPHTGNPLYLRALLEELRVYGDHQTLDRQIETYLAARSVDELYERILERYERDYERERPGLVRDAMSYIWAARRGLSEAELLDVLGSEGAPLPRAYWSPLYLAAERALVIRGGLLSFFHQYLRRAVERRYLRANAERVAAHERLADYFEHRPRTDRQLDELPWQLLQGYEWIRLARLLADLGFLSALRRVDRDAPAAYWADLEAHSTHTPSSCYRDVLANPKADVRATLLVADLLAALGHAHEALLATEAVTEQFQQDGEAVTAARGRLAQASMLGRAGQSEQALTMIDEPLRVLRQAGDKQGVIYALDERAYLLSLIGRRRELAACLEDLQRACVEATDSGALAHCKVKQAWLLENEGRVAEAISLVMSAERTAREQEDRSLLVGCLNLRAWIAGRSGAPGEQLALYGEMERVCREGGDKVNLATCLMSQAKLLSADPTTREMALTKCDEARALFTSANRTVEVHEAKLLIAGLTTGVAGFARLGKPATLALLTLPCLGMIVAGLALGFWKPWLWLIGGPLVVFGAVNLLNLWFPRLRSRTFRLTQRLSAERHEEEVRGRGH
jgi:tetratricopeptide (TPR) repeat protein